MTATSDDSSPVLGQFYSMDCVGHSTLSGLMNLPSPLWLTPSGSLLSSSNEVQLQGPRSVGLSSSELVARFFTLRTSHAGSYICQASLSSPALTSPIVKTQTFEITVQSKSAISPLFRNGFILLVKFLSIYHHPSLSTTWLHKQVTGAMFFTGAYMYEIKPSMHGYDACYYMGCLWFVGRHGLNNTVLTIKASD